MKEDSFKFSLADFLGYLFPGVIALSAIAGLLFLSPFRQELEKIPFNLVTGLILIPFAYFTGVIISSLTYNFEDSLYEHYELTNPLDEIHPKECEARVQAAYKEVFKLNSDEEITWSKSHFYVTRALVREQMPKCAAISDRQNSLWQIRRNGLLSIFLLGITGLVAGAKIAILNYFYGRGEFAWWWGMFLGLVSVLVAGVILRNLIKTGMYNNRRREAREVCSALMVFHCQQPKSK